MITDFQKIAEPLIREVFSLGLTVKRIDECRGVVHLDFESDETSIRLSWEPFGPPWAQITDIQGGTEQIRIDPLKVDSILISPDMKTEMETKELLNLIEQRLK